MQFKSTQEYNPSNYGSYAVTSVKEDFTLNTVHPRGLQEYLDYDIYDIGEQTLIAFTKFNYYKTDFVYRVVSQNYTEEIQSENYEFLTEALTGSYDKNQHVFYMMQSISDFDTASAGTYQPVDTSRRCDLESYSGLGFHDTIVADGKPYFIDLDYMKNDNVLGWTLYLTSLGNINIVKLEFVNIEEHAYKDWAGCSLMGETFTFVLKMAYQWSLLNQEPWNNSENVSTRCKNAFEHWNMPEDVIQEILDSQPPTPLELFFSGDENPRRSVEANRIMPTKFKNWYISKIRYRTLGSLKQNFPIELSIPDSMIQKEKTFFETETYRFCIENELDILSTTSIDILDRAYLVPSYKETNNSITDIIIKNTYLEDVVLIKEYRKTKSASKRTQNATNVKRDG